MFEKVCSGIIIAGWAAVVGSLSYAIVAEVNLDKKKTALKARELDILEAKNAAAEHPQE